MFSAMPDIYWNSYGIFCYLLISAFVSFAAYVVVALIRPKFSVKVNCWFCNKYSIVPHGNRNCWDCPFCEQYNGFDENDDYNKPIPAQYDELLNLPNRWESETESLPSPSNGLCETCNRNQLLKIKQLATFVPQHEKCYDVEVELFNRQLDCAYKLCHRCEAFLHQKLGQQDASLRGKVFSWKIQQHQKQKPCHGRVYCRVPKFVLLLQLSSLCIITCICIQSLNVHQNETNAELIPLHKVFPRRFLSYLALTKKWICSPEFSLLGFFLLIGAILSAGKDRLRVIDALACFTWLLMLFIQVPIITSYFPTSEASFLVQYIFSFLGTIVTAWSMFCSRARSAVGGSWKRIGSNSSPQSWSDVNNCSLSSDDQTSIFDVNSQLEKYIPKSPTSHADMLQDNRISTTTLGKACRNLNLELSLNSPLQAMKIGTPKKSLNASGIFKKKIYSSQSSLLSSSNSSLNSQRSVLSPARLTAKTIAHSSWVGGGYWSTDNPRYSRSLFTTAPSGQFSRGFYRPLNSSFSCPVSRDGSIAGDDKVSVYSEPGHQRTSFSYGDRNYRSSLSPVKDLEHSANNSTASSESSHSRLSERNAVTPKNVSVGEHSNSPKSFTGFSRKTCFQFFLGFSIAANIALMCYVYNSILT